MRRVMAFTICAVLAAALLPSSLCAAVAGTQHDVTADSVHYEKFGVCGPCHIPSRHRLWPRDIWKSVDDRRGEVGALCSFCHDPAAGMMARARTRLPFRDLNPETHGLSKALAPDGIEALDTSLPYVTYEGDLQCTTCHNVHDNSRRPFLQVSGEKLCLHCHPDGPGRKDAHGEGAEGSEGTAD